VNPTVGNAGVEAVLLRVIIQLVIITAVAQQPVPAPRTTGGLR
jgi:hypothetical protein